jgi:hypothetical protein
VDGGVEAFLVADDFEAALSLGAGVVDKVVRRWVGFDVAEVEDLLLRTWGGWALVDDISGSGRDAFDQRADSFSPIEDNNLLHFKFNSIQFNSTSLVLFNLLISFI